MIRVVDVNSNKNDNIKSAAEFLGKSKWKRAIFIEIYRGKPRAKTADDIRRKVDGDARKILTIGNELVKAGMVEPTTVNGRVAYLKLGWLDQLKHRILNYAAHPKALAKLPTKVNPQPGDASSMRIRYWGKPVQVQEITIDDIASFARVRKIVKVPPNRLAVPETVFKEGVKTIIGETGRFKDWPGERFDVLSTRLKLKTTRIATAFAFKGPGKKGILMALDLGRRGDQILRLFHSEAQVFIVQYWGQVDESVSELMRTFAVARSLYHFGQRVYYGVIDGKDSDRLVLAYRKAFKLPKPAPSKKRPK